MVKIEELIIQMMPFSQELKEYCNVHPNFFKALKVIYFDKFITLEAIITSYSPNYPQDEVIGVYVYDYMNKVPRFKQDFIVNIGSNGKKFILYTGLSDAVNGKTVKHINEFLADYGKGGYYKNTHWQTFNELPGELKERAQRAISLGEKRKAAGNPTISQELVEETYKKWQKHK